MAFHFAFAVQILSAMRDSPDTIQRPIEGAVGISSTYQTLHTSAKPKWNLHK